MQRLVLAAVFVAAIVVVGVLLFKSARRLFADTGPAERDTGTAMQKVAFILLVCLMVYVSFSGAS